MFLGTRGILFSYVDYNKIVERSMSVNGFFCLRPTDLSLFMNYCF